MIDALKSADVNFFLFLNGKHNSFFDFIMYWASDRFIWIPFYAGILFLLIKNFKKKTYILLVIIAAIITISDQFSSAIVKNNVRRLRPCHNPEIENRVHIVNGVCGGSFGYFSSHASNSFALAVFLILVFRRKEGEGEILIGRNLKMNRHIFDALLLSYATLISYSRIYLGCHYPFDVFTGIVFGTILSIIFAQLFIFFQRQKKYINEKQIVHF